MSEDVPKFFMGGLIYAVDLLNKKIHVTQAK